MTKPQLHRHLTTGTFNQLSKILQEASPRRFLWDRAIGINPIGPRTLRAFRVAFRFSARPTVFSATKSDYQAFPISVNVGGKIFFLPLARFSPPRDLQNIDPADSSSPHAAAPVFGQTGELILLATTSFHEWKCADGNDRLCRVLAVAGGLSQLGLAESLSPEMSLHGFPAIRKPATVENRADAS